jgi:hypothetical protein
MGSGKRHVGDTRVFADSTYYLERDYVDKFADEVQPRAQLANNEELHSEEPEIVEDDTLDQGGDPTDGILSTDPLPPPCADHWKAAASTEHKKMWAIFDETGLFASACRHGLILWIADMIRCGEL